MFRPKITLTSTTLLVAGAKLMRNRNRMRIINRNWRGSTSQDCLPWCKLLWRHCHRHRHQTREQFWAVAVADDRANAIAIGEWQSRCWRQWTRKSVAVAAPWIASQDRKTLITDNRWNQSWRSSSNSMWLGRNSSTSRPKPMRPSGKLMIIIRKVNGINSNKNQQKKLFIWKQNDLWWSSLSGAIVLCPLQKAPFNDRMINDHRWNKLHFDELRHVIFQFSMYSRLIIKFFWKS